MCQLWVDCRLLPGHQAQLCRNISLLAYFVELAARFVSLCWAGGYQMPCLLNWLPPAHVKRGPPAPSCVLRVKAHHVQLLLGAGLLHPADPLHPGVHPTQGICRPICGCCRHLSPRAANSQQKFTLERVFGIGTLLEGNLSAVFSSVPPNLQNHPWGVGAFPIPHARLARSQIELRVFSSIVETDIFSDKTLGLTRPNSHLRF